MIDSATASALADVAMRVNDLLRSNTTAFDPEANDIRRDVPRISPDPSPLSVAAPPNAYFVTAGADGKRSYTRDGSFAISAGKLVDARGADVYGYAAAGGPLVPLAADPLDVALGRVRDARIDSDGSYAYSRTTIDPRSGASRTQRVVAGTLALARFPAASNLVRGEAGAVRAPAGIEPHLGRPGDGNFAAIANFSRDRGTLDLDLGLVRLHDAYERVDALGAVHHARGEFDRVALELLK